MRIEEAIKVLHDLQKYRRDKHVPSKYPMPHPKRIGEAIDCAIHNLRTCVAQPCGGCIRGREQKH